MNISVALMVGADTPFNGKVTQLKEGLSDNFPYVDYLDLEGKKYKIEENNFNVETSKGTSTDYTKYIVIGLAALLGIILFVVYKRKK